MCCLTWLHGAPIDDSILFTFPGLLIKDLQILYASFCFWVHIGGGKIKKARVQLVFLALPKPYLYTDHDNLTYNKHLSTLPLHQFCWISNIHFKLKCFSLGCTPLHWAAIRGNLESCTVLVQAGKKEDLMVQDNTGLTPAQLAADKNHRQVAFFLVSAMNIHHFLFIIHENPSSFPRFHHTVNVAF